MYLAGLSSQSPSRQGVPQVQMPGRVSVTDSYHGQEQEQEPVYALHEGMYAQYEPQYGQYDPNMTGSVFEDSGGLVTPLPGTLGSPHPHHPHLPHQAPRAVFDEDEQEPAPHPASNMFVNRHKTSDNTGWCFLRFLFFRIFFLTFFLAWINSLSDHLYLKTTGRLIITGELYYYFLRIKSISFTGSKSSG